MECQLFLLALLPGKSTILEGIHGWELRPTFRGPRFPRWMENGVSSFNQFIHELSLDSDTSNLKPLSGEGDGDQYEYSVTPSSQSSRATGAYFTKHNKQSMTWIQYILFWVFFPLKVLCCGLLLWICCVIFWVCFPVKCLLHVPFRLCLFFFPMASKTLSTSGNQRPSRSYSNKSIQSLKDYIIHRTTDRRRGVVEDLHLAIEIFIEGVFDFVHKAVHLLLSPSEAFRTLFRLFSSPESGANDGYDNLVDATVSTSTHVGDDPRPTVKNTSFHHSLNTDARTCQDVITELGYPYEAICVITSDGYVLLLERIPRRDARKAVYLQHGILDSSMGWVSNGIVGSPAFAAYDQGYDVFLGNFRGLVSREHVNKNISSYQYWRYSINEHGTKDIPALIEKIHQVKTAELSLSQPNIVEESNGNQPYKLCAICHSLGGAASIMYIITRRIEEKPHRLSRLVLLSPAGFHDDSNIVFSLSEHLLFLVAPILSRVIPAFYIPTKFFRMLLNKLARDLHNLPAVGGLFQTLMSYLLVETAQTGLGF